METAKELRAEGPGVGFWLNGRNMNEIAGKFDIMLTQMAHEWGEVRRWEAIRLRIEYWPPMPIPRLLYNLQVGEMVTVQFEPEGSQAGKPYHKGEFTLVRPATFTGGEDGEIIFSAEFVSAGEPRANLFDGATVGDGV